MAEQRRLEQQLGGHGDDQSAAENGAVTVDGGAGQLRVAARGDDQQRQPGRGEAQHRRRQEEAAGGGGTVPEVTLRVGVDHHRAEHTGHARQGYAPPQPPPEPAPSGRAHAGGHIPIGQPFEPACRSRPGPRGVEHRQSREHAEGQDLAAEPRVPQPQNGPVGIARAAEMQHADPQRQQAEHQGAGAVHRSDASRRCPRNQQLQQPLHQKRTDRELSEGQHQDQRPVRLLRTHGVVVSRHHVAREHPLGPVGGRGQRQSRLGRSGHEQVGLGLLDHLLHVHHTDRDGAVRARLHARRGFPLGEPVAAHVAFADDPFRAAVLRRFVGTGERAVLATEALVVEVLDDTGDRVLLVGLHRTRVHAGGVEAVVAGGRDVLDDRETPAPAVQQPDVAPRLFLLETVQGVAGRHARLAAGTGVEIDVEGVLLAGSRRGRRHQRRIALGQRRTAGVRGIVRLCEARHGGDLLLLQIPVDEGRRTSRNCSSRAGRRRRDRLGGGLRFESQDVSGSGHRSHPARASRGAAWNCSVCTRSAGTPSDLSQPAITSMKVDGPHRK